MIELDTLEFHYPKSDFRLTISKLSIASGQAVALIGPSGCGKTTLLHLIAGITPSQTGSVRVNGTDVSASSDLQRRHFRIQNLGFVFQDFALLEYLTLFDNILHPYRLNPILKLNKDVKERAKHLAEQMGISHKLKSYPAKSSHGEQQRTAICRALVTQPKLLLADEPTANLDPSQKQTILELLLEYIRSHNATLILATHDHDLLSAFDQVIDFRALKNINLKASQPLNIPILPAEPRGAL